MLFSFQFFSEKGIQQKGTNNKSCFGFVDSGGFLVILPQGKDDKPLNPQVHFQLPAVQTKLGGSATTGKVAAGGETSTAALSRFGTNCCGHLLLML